MHGNTGVSNPKSFGFGEKWLILISLFIVVALYLTIVGSIERMRKVNRGHLTNPIRNILPLLLEFLNERACDNGLMFGQYFSFYWKFEFKKLEINKY